MFLLHKERAETALGRGIVGHCRGTFFISTSSKYPNQLQIPVHISKWDVSEVTMMYRISRNARSRNHIAIFLIDESEKLQKVCLF